jgi:hypothetical protein
MFDTNAISKSSARQPDIDLLIKRGCKPLYSQTTGEPYKLVLNQPKNSHEPRITISKNHYKELWIFKSEVSVPAWLHGSNLYLPDESDIERYFSMLTDYVGDNIGVRFNARIERVTRIDVTRDIQTGEGRVLPIIAEINKMRIPKYDWRPFNDTTASFHNKGKVKNKRYDFYSKFHEVAAKHGSLTEIEMSKDLLRIEVPHKNNVAVYNLAKSLKYPNHNAQTILTRETHERVINQTMKLFNIERFLESENSSVENLFNAYDSLTAFRLTGHLYLKSQYGADYGELPFINVTKRTIKEYERLCVKAGSLSI